MFVHEGRLAESLAEVPPGPELAVLLASVDRRTLSGHERVILLQAHARQVSHYQAEMYADMVAVTESHEEIREEIELAWESAASEIRAALTWTRRAADTALDWAHELVVRLPQVWRALHQGLLDLPRARTFGHQTGHLDQETARRVADEALPEAGGLTTGQLVGRLAGLAISADPASAEKRYRGGLEERRVVCERNPDGTATLLGVNLAPDRTQAALGRINHLAQAARSPHDHRSIDQIRADIFLELLEGNEIGASSGRQRAVVDVRVDLTTLAGLDDHPAQIPGWGPVLADIGRQVAHQAGSQWRMSITDPGSGEVVATALTRRRPAAGLRRHIEAQIPACVFPGCRVPATRSDLDHTRAWAEGGTTTSDNLAPLCRHDHRLKHEAGWEVTRTGHRYQWTSPLGHQYTTQPP